MREIKFDYIYQHEDTGTLIRKTESMEDIERKGKPELWRYTMVARRQFTGLKDMNGVEIYEGDIIEYSNKLGHHTEFSRLFVIEFGEQDLGHASYQQTIGWNATIISQFGKPSGMDSGRLSRGVLDLFGCHNVKIIGNIYENPELLEAK